MIFVVELMQSRWDSGKQPESILKGASNVCPVGAVVRR